MIIKTFEELTVHELYNILKARSEVFMMELNIRYLDMDDIDYDAIHIFETYNDHVTSYLRMYKGEDKDSYKIGRVLVRYRKRGAGKLLITCAEDYARQRGKTKLICDAQIRSRGFYEKIGFTAISSTFIEAGIPHIKMEKKL